MPHGEDAASIRCDNCLRFGTPVRRVALLVEGELVRERDLCSACLCNWRELMQEPAPWLGTAFSQSGRDAQR